MVWICCIISISFWLFLSIENNGFSVCFQFCMRIFIYAFRNIWRNPFLSFSTLLLLVLVTFFASILLLVEHTTDVLIREVIKQLSLSVYLKKDIVQESGQLQVFMRELRTIDPSIEVEYKSSEDALFDLQNKFWDELTSIIENKEDNTLPGKVFIQIKNDQQLRDFPTIYNKINNIVERNQSILRYNDQGSLHKSLVDYPSQYERIKKLVNIFKKISWGAFAILILVIFSATAMIYSSIGNMVFYSREEVNIIGLVGGSNYYLYTPFILQSVIYILLAFGISSALFFATLQALSVSILAGYPDFIHTFYTARWWEMITIFSVFLFVGALGGYISVAHALRLIRNSNR